MKALLGSRRLHYLTIVGTFLLVVALITGMAGCDGDGDGNGNGNGDVSYTLTVTSTSGGLVIEPGEEISTFNEGAVVNLVAEAGEGCQFFEWTGDVHTIADIYDATTNITMNSDYSIMANFGGYTYDIYTRFQLFHTLDDDGSILSASKCLTYSAVADGTSQQQLVITDKLPTGISFGSVQVEPSGCANYAYNQSTGDLRIDMDFSQAPPSPYNEIFIRLCDLQIPGFIEPAVLAQTPTFSHIFEEVSSDKVCVDSSIQFEISITEGLSNTQIFIIAGNLFGGDTVSLLSYSPESHVSFPDANEVNWIYDASITVPPRHEAVFDVNGVGTSVGGYNPFFVVYHGMLIRTGNFTVTSSGPLDSFDIFHSTSFGYHNYWNYTFGSGP